MYFKTIEPTTFGNAMSHVLFSFDNQGIRDTDILTNSNRETVDTINALKVQLFYGLSCVKEKFAKQFPDLMHPPIETAFTEHSRHKPCAADKAKGLLIVSREIHTSQQDDCDDFRVSRFMAFSFFMIHRFQYIVKKHIYCNGFINYG
jgi:hypothetical protein